MAQPYSVRRKVFKWLWYSGLIALCFLVQSAGFLPAVWGVRPNLLLVLPVCIAMCEGDLAGTVVGAVCGLLADILFPGVNGFFPLLLVVCGLTAGALVRRIFRNNIVSALLLCGLSVTLIKLLEWFLFTYFARVDTTAFSLIHRTLPAIAYTGLLIAPCYYLCVWIKGRFELVAD